MQSCFFSRTHPLLQVAASSGYSLMRFGELNCFQEGPSKQQLDGDMVEITQPYGWNVKINSPHDGAFLPERSLIITTTVMVHFYQWDKNSFVYETRSMHGNNCFCASMFYCKRVFKHGAMKKKSFKDQHIWVIPRLQPGNKIILSHKIDRKSVV